jgi:protein involved in polysaccharide export with SLBB domain
VASILLAGNSAAFASGSLQKTPAFDTGQITEEEKLYRYFGAAAALHKDGRYKEAIEILQYILDKNPHDDYIKDYLKRVKNEMRKHKALWKKDSTLGARQFKRKRIKTLVQDGIIYYKEGFYDKALLKFSDALSLSPGNSVATRYMKRLKKHYEKEINIENLTQKQTDKQSPARGPIDKIDLEYIALEKRADDLLNTAELDFRIEEIIIDKKSEERRAKQLTLGAGDTVQISVLDHPELSGQVTVQINGEIILPLVNDFVIARDLTLDELTEAIKKTMKRYVQDPKVNISAMEYKSKTYYVIDEVSCTPYPITRPDFTLRDALFTADWGNNRALGRVIVTKPSKRHPIVKKVNAFDLVYRGKLGDNIRIDDGDVVYVPMTIAAKISKSLYDFLGPFRAVRQARDHYLNLKWNEKDWEDILRTPPDYDAQAEDGKDVRLENISLRDYIVTR